MAEGDYVQMTCAVTYNGKWAPIALWQETSGVTVVAANNVTEGKRLIGTQVIKVTPAKKNREFYCNVFFDQPSPDSVPQNAASNKLRQTSCFTKTLVVYYAEDG